MFSTLRNRFGIPGVISVIALVFAMIGGAYAANNSGDGNATASAKKKAKKKSAKGPRGPRGPRGAAGAAGPAGPVGPAGAQGAKGDNGSNGAAGATGATGSAGAAGQSVTTEEIFAFEECGDEEGVRFNSASGENHVCNGAAGDPWAAGGTLPVGAAQTGTFAVSGPEVVVEGEDVTAKLQYSPFKAMAPISFAIPLANSLDENHVVYVPSVGANPDPTNCSGSPADPQAVSGYLCIYEGNNLAAPFQFALKLDAAGFGASTAGTTLSFNAPTESAFHVFGAWAVTG